MTDQTMGCCSGPPMDIQRVQPSSTHQLPNSGPRPLEVFKLERFFSKYEFTAPYLACCSDCQPIRMDQLLAMADQEAQKLWQDLTLGYTETQGLPALRQEVSTMYEHVTPQQLVVLAPEEGVFLTMHALIKPGDRVVSVFPGYQSLYEVAASLGAELSRWEPRLGEGGAITWDVAHLKALLGPATRLVVVNFPHNPTGTTLTHEQWQEVVEACRATGAYLFSDEMYRLLELDPSSRIPAAADSYGRGISLSGVSKTLNCPGLRIGWLACRDSAFLRRVLELKDWTTICSSAPSEVLALVAVRARSRMLASNVAMLRRHVAAVQDFMATMGDMFEWVAPAASACSCPRLKSGEPIDDFCERLVQATGVLLLPTSVYDHPPLAALGYFRLGLGRTNLPACLARIQAFCRQQELPA